MGQDMLVILPFFFSIPFLLFFNYPYQKSILLHYFHLSLPVMIRNLPNTSSNCALYNIKCSDLSWNSSALGNWVYSPPSPSSNSLLSSWLVKRTRGSIKNWNENWIRSITIERTSLLSWLKSLGIIISMKKEHGYLHWQFQWGFG